MSKELSLNTIEKLLLYMQHKYIALSPFLARLKVEVIQSDPRLIKTAYVAKTVYKEMVHLVIADSIYERLPDKDKFKYIYFVILHELGHLLEDTHRQYVEFFKIVRPADNQEMELAEILMNVVSDYIINTKFSSSIPDFRTEFVTEEGDKIRMVTHLHYQLEKLVKLDASTLVNAINIWNYLKNQNKLDQFKGHPQEFMEYLLKGQKAHYCDIQEEDTQAKEQRERIKTELRQSSQIHKGCLPGDLEMMLEISLGYEEPWHIGLARVITNFMYEDYSYSRLHPYYTYNTNFILGTFTGREGVLALGIDVSGSMIGFLEQYLRQLSHIISATEIKELWVLHCDVEVTFKKKFTMPLSQEDIKEICTVKGGGGTSFIALFEEVDKLYEKYKDAFMGLCLLSDTYGDFPKKKPPYPVAVALPTSLVMSEEVPKWAKVIRF